MTEIASPPPGQKLKFWEAALYLLAVGLGIRWIAVAAAVGPASLRIWLLALFVFFVPLAVATAELSARYQGEGGIYLWARDGIGPLARCWLRRDKAPPTSPTPPIWRR